MLQSASIAKDIVALAKYLRRSADEYIRGNVYINADLTRAEAEAAFHARCERRRLQQLKLSRPKPVTSESSERQQHQLRSQMTSPVSCSLPVNRCISNVPVNACSTADGSSSSHCITVAAEVHRPMYDYQALQGSVQPEVLPSGSFPMLPPMPPPTVMTQQSLATGTA